MYPMPMYSAGFSTLASFGNADEDGESMKDEALLFLSKLEARDLTHTSAINGMLFCRRGGRPGAIPALTSGTTHRH